MSNQKYIDLRGAGLEVTDTRGQQFMDESVTTMDFARKTAEYGHSYRDMLQQVAEDDTEYDSARFIGYELAEKARKAGIDSIDPEIDEMETTMDLSENWIEKFYNSFDLVDRLQGGFIHDRLTDVDYERSEDGSVPGFDPSNPYRNQQQALESFTKNDPDDIGKLFGQDIFVLNDEWMAYKLGENVPTVESDVENFLAELGVL